MKRTCFLFLIIIILSAFVSCKGKNSNPGDKQGLLNTSNNDSSVIRKTILDFYTWYSNNYEKFMQFDLYSGIKKADAPPYKINWEEVKKYQDYIRGNVPQLGEEFLNNQAILFKKCDSAFKVNVEEEVPFYFDFDWYTNSQEDPGYLLEEIKKSTNWLISVENDRATVDIKGEDVTGAQPAVTIIFLEVKKEHNGWKITRIANE